MIVNANSITQYVIQINKGTIKHVNANIKNYCTCKKDYSWNPSSCIYENSKYLKSTSVSECDRIINPMTKVSIKNTDVTSTASINCHGIKVRNCNILDTVLLAITIIIILIIIIIR